MGETNIIPFGKYRGQPVEVLQSDMAYAEWLQAQGWVKERYPQFYTLIINNMQEPQETPAHNKLQAMFLDKMFSLKFVQYIQHDPNIIVIGINKIFFEDKAIDVRINVRAEETYENKKYICSYDVAIEIKPSLGDDYPATLRQVLNMPMITRECVRVVLIEKYTGVGASLDQVKQMFALSGIRLLLLEEII